MDLVPLHFLVHVNVLARLFRGKFLTMVMDAHADGQLKFFNTHAETRPTKHFKRFLAPLRRIKWVSTASSRSGDPSRCSLSVALHPSHCHLEPSAGRCSMAASHSDGRTIASKVRPRKTMTLAPHEFIRRFLIHVLPKGFHRIRNYGLFANGNRAESIAKARELLAVATAKTEPEAASTQHPISPACCHAHAPAAVAA